MKVLFLTNIPSPYRVEFFNQFGTKCELTVLYQKERSAERDEKWVGDSRNTYRSVFLNGISTGVDHALSFEVLKYLKKDQYDFIFICGLASPTEMLALTWCKLRGIPYYFESDGGVPKSGVGFKERIKRFNLQGAKGYFSTGEMHDKYYRAYGVTDEKIIHYPFSSVVDCDIIDAPLLPEEKRRLRIDNGFSSETMVITVGQFIPRKGIDVLLKAWDKSDPNSMLIIVGGEPTTEYLALTDEISSDKVRFVPFMSKNELKEYYRMADLFVFPTREDIWGLVVNEAAAMGLPIVSTDRAGAAIELIQDGRNGYIVAGENVDALRAGIEKYMNLSDEEKMAMANASLETARQFTIEKMVERHIQFCEE